MSDQFLQRCKSYGGQGAANNVGRGLRSCWVLGVDVSEQGTAHIEDSGYRGADEKLQNQRNGDMLDWN